MKELVFMLNIKKRPLRMLVSSLDEVKDPYGTLGFDLYMRFREEK